MMIVLLCLVAVIRAAWSAPTELKAHENVILGKPTTARCDPHMIYELGTVTCICSKDGFWPHDKCEHAFKSLHNPETNNTKLKAEKDNLDSDIKKMIAANYEIKKLVITNHDPPTSEHRKLQDTKDEQGASKGEGGMESGDSCEPNTYFFRDCNVCKCSAQGVVERCTQNKCEGQTARRVYDNVQGSCVPDNWYALAPCQFCYCQQSNKLVCSTQFRDNSNLLALGSYNLTNCGPNFVKELYDLSPDVNGSNNLLREGAALQAPPPTPAPNLRADAQSATRSRTTIKLTAWPYDAGLQVSVHLKKPNEVEAAKVEYGNETEEENGTATLREGQDQSTLSPFENEEESIEEETPKPIINQYVKLPNGNYKQVVNQEPASLKIPSQPSILNAMMMAQGMPLEIVRILASMPEVSQMHSPLLEPAQQETRNYDVSIQEAKPDLTPVSHVVRISLPSVVERIIKLGLRKSMVKIDSSHTCTPGITSQDGCNFCYCLKNGKLLCTDKKTC